MEKYFKAFDTQLRNQRIGNTAKALQVTIEKINRLGQKIKDGTYKLFKPDFHFSEAFDRKNEIGKKVGGFDIVIGNPPYGVAVDDDIKEWHGLGSKDSYGVFISTAIKRFLKPGGVLSYIVSDTWLTIKTHKPLREQVLNKQLHKILRLHQDCFEATVNACIMSLTNSPDENYPIIVADLTNISTRKEVEELRNKLYHLEEHVGKSTQKYAVYQYNQDLIKGNSNIPIFVGSPKLFIFLNEVNVNNDKLIYGNRPFSIIVNNIEITIAPLQCFIAEICGGIKSYDNKKYIKSLGGTEAYPIINKELIVRRELTKYEKDNGIEIHDPHTAYYLEFEKGGETVKDNNCFNNYYYPTRYYFPWSENVIRELLPINALRNKHRYFDEGIGVTAAGVYSPLFRYVKLQLFQNGFQVIFLRNKLDTYWILGILCSKLLRYIFNVFINHSVNSNAQDVATIPIIVTESENDNSKKLLNEKVITLVQLLKINPEYNFENEQIDIDILVYKMYGLNEGDIHEVETWYARRYPKLARYCEI